MTRLKLVVSGLLLTAAGLLSAVPAAPASASPAADTITVFSAFSPPTQSGLLTVSIAASSAITSITAHLRAPRATADALAVSDFALQSGTTTDGVWTVNATIAWGTGTGKLPLGVYSIYVDAKDQGGTSVSRVFAGNLDFLILPALTFSARPMAVTYTHHVVTFHGRLTGTYPDGKTVRPLAGRAISVTALDGTDSVRAITNSLGRYAVRHAVRSTLYLANTASSNRTLNNGFGQAGPIFLTATPDPVRVRAHLAKARVRYLQTDTVTGTVSYRVGSSWLPLRNSPVTVNGTATLYGTTNRDGAFRIQFPKLTTTTSWSVGAGGTLFLLPGTATLPTLAVAIPIVLERVSLRLTSTGKVHASGCVVFPELAFRNDQSTLPIRVQFSAHSRGPWRLLGIMFFGSGVNGACPFNNASLMGTFRARLANAYYRERVPNRRFNEAAVSRVVHLRRG